MVYQKYKREAIRDKNGIWSGYLVNKNLIKELENEYHKYKILQREQKLKRILK